MRPFLFAPALCLALSASVGASAGDDAPSTRAFLFIPLATADYSFSQAAYEGYKVASDAGYRIEVKDHADNLSEAEIIAIVDAEYAAGVTAFVFAGNELSAAATAAAAKYPKAYFATIAGDAKGGNVINFCLDCLSPGGYLAGKIAAELTKTNVVGFVGGLASVDGPEASQFEQTVLAEDPGAKVLIDWTNDWSDVAGAARLTENQIAAGADVIFATANTGVITAAGRYPSVRIIGMIVDVAGLSNNVAASVVIQTDVVYRKFIDSVAAGTFRSGFYEATTDDGIWAVVRTR